METICFSEATINSYHTHESPKPNLNKFLTTLLISCFQVVYYHFAQTHSVSSTSVIAIALVSYF